jgi:hypothetical protein
MNETLRRYHGTPCPWCNRAMTWQGRGISHDRGATRDHLVPQIRGGRFTVIVCRRCNSDKADIRMDVWLVLLERAGDARAAIVRQWMERHPNLMQQVRSREASAFRSHMDDLTPGAPP